MVITIDQRWGWALWRGPPPCCQRLRVSVVKARPRENKEGNSWWEQAGELLQTRGTADGMGQSKQVGSGSQRCHRGQRSSVQLLVQTQGTDALKLQFKSLSGSKAGKQSCQRTCPPPTRLSLSESLSYIPRCSISRICARVGIQLPGDQRCAVLQRSMS